LSRWSESHSAPIETPVCSDGPDCFYQCPPFECWKEKSTAFRLPPRIHVDMTMPRLNHKEQMPAFVKRLAHPKVREVNPWNKPPPHRPVPVPPSRGRRSAPTLPDQNFLGPRPGSSASHRAAPSAGTRTHMARSASSGAMTHRRAPQQQQNDDAAAARALMQRDEEVRQLRDMVRDRDALISQLLANGQSDSPPQHRAAPAAPAALEVAAAPEAGYVRSASVAALPPPSVQFRACLSDGASVQLRASVLDGVD
jgi:hypothetical protein